MPDTHYLGQPLNFAIPLRTKQHGDRYQIIDNHEILLIDGIGGPQDAQYIVDAVNEYQTIREAIIQVLDELKGQIREETKVWERLDNDLYEKVMYVINERIVQYGA